MVDLLQPFARAILLAVDELADGVERRRGEMARLRLIGKIVGVELADKFGERLGDFVGVLIAVARILPLRAGERLCRSSSSAQTPSTYAACWW